MKRILFIIAFLVAVISLSAQTAVVADGRQHQFIKNVTLSHGTDGTYILDAGEYNYGWNISFLWTSPTVGIDSTSMKLQAYAGNTWIDYAVDTCSVSGTAGVCSFEDYMLNFERLRVKVTVYGMDTLTLNGYYRFVRK